MKQTLVIKTTVTVGEEELDMNLVCDFVVEMGEPETADDPYSGGSVVLLEASHDGKSMMDNLNKFDKEWLCEKMWEAVQSADINE